MTVHVADVLTEIRQRMRRVETRLTRYMEAQGFETQTQKPVWDGTSVVVSTPNVSMKEVLAVVPPDWHETVSIIHDGAVMMRFKRPRKS